MNLNINMMSCITNDLIQKYIDGEANLQESASINNHLAKCEDCKGKVRSQKNLVIDIKNALNIFIDDTIEIPPMIFPPQVNRRRPVLRERLIYAVAAACVLLFFVMIIPNKQDVNQDEITMLHGFDEDYDANLPLDQQKMIITVVDPAGKTTDFYLE